MERSDEKEETEIRKINMCNIVIHLVAAMKWNLFNKKKSSPRGLHNSQKKRPNFAEYLTLTEVFD